MEVPSAWFQVRPTSEVAAVVFKETFRLPPSESSGALETVQGCQKEFTGPKRWMRNDVARKIAQSSVARLDKALEALGDVAGAAVEVLKAKLTKGKAACGGCGTQSVSQVHCLRRIRELDTQSAEECVLKTEAQERVAGSRVPRPHHRIARHR